DTLLTLDEKRRKVITEAEALKAQLNKASKEVGQLKAAKKDAEAAAKQSELKQVSDRIADFDKQVRNIDASLENELLYLPNLPHESVLVGKTAEDNKLVSEWGRRPEFNFTPLPHWDLGENMGIIDFERGVKLSGARFYVLTGLGARLDRALINFFLDVHTKESGYTEVFTPQLVKREIMVGTGQLPKFEEDMYRVDSDDLFLIPTAEVPLINLHRDEILEAADLPKYYTGYTACFRRESGAAGKDTRGVMRVHQFNKVELVKLCTPETSYDELEKMRTDAEAVLRKLGLHYRVVKLCTGDLGFAAAKTYDLEVWMPGQNRYVEISSVSNCEDFQARRANLRFRPGPKEKPRFLHTLNGSGLAVGRCLAAILENYQQPTASFRLPDILHPYVGAPAIP
ncbi:MAG: serine--tRNA ligase, partial [bacterium]